MAFTQPAFNLTVNIWRAATPPGTIPPDVTAMCNLTWGKRVNAPASGGTGAIGVVFLAPVLLLPKGTDIRSDEKCSTGNDTCEVPAGSGRFYTVIYVDDLGKGFANEHRGALLQSRGGWPQPIP
jgi:hypothetical protein